MCLHTNEGTARLAENDIVCYKVMRRVRYDDKYMLRSEYYNFNYSIGKSYLCYDFSKEAERHITRYDDYVVNHGFHSYMRLDEALLDARVPYVNSLVIVKCVIPKGSLMFSAADSCEYCSDHIKVIGWESPEVVYYKALSKQRVDSIEWKDTIENYEEPKYAKGVHKIVKAFKSWMSK